VKKLCISSLELFNGLEPDTQANFYNQAICYLRSGDVGLAIQLLLKSAGEGYSQKFSTGVWNALGVAYFITSQGKLAQDAFVRALHIDPTQAQTWSNLGFLYLEYGQYLLANRAFGNAFSSDPEDGYAWIGQALVIQNDKNLDSGKQSELFYDHIRHSQLGCINNFHVLGGLEYAYSSMLNGEENYKKWSRITPIVTKYSKMFNENSELADLLKNECLIKEKLEAAVDVSGLEPSLKAEISLKQGEFKNAINTLNQAENETNNENHDYTSFLKVLSFQANNDTENALESLDNLLENENLPIEIREKFAILQAQLEFIDDSEDSAKTLFEFFQEAATVNYKLSHAMLGSLGAIGVSNGKENMVKLVLKEMYQNHDLTVESVLLEAWLLRNDEFNLQKHLQKAVHMRPDKAELWMLLSRGCVLKSFKVTTAKTGRCLDAENDTQYYLSLLDHGIKNKDVQREIINNPRLIKQYL
jgi:Tfp pilus assembly protein PilF